MYAQKHTMHVYMHTSTLAHTRINTSISYIVPRSIRRFRPSSPESSDPGGGGGAGAHAPHALVMVLAGAVSAVLRAIAAAATELVAEQAGVEHEDVEELREREDDHERLEHSQTPPAVPADVDLLACEPEGERGDGPGHQRRRGVGGEAVPAPGAHVVDAGELGGTWWMPARTWFFCVKSEWNYVTNYS